jgi:Flp pilus assembly protein TadG
MLISRPAGGRRRAGATSVEFALVAVVLFMLLFGIYEYGRYLFIKHITNNAAHDAARFAVVHTGGPTMATDPVTIDEQSIRDVFLTGKVSGHPTVYGRGMFGMQHNIEGLRVYVFAVPDADLYASPPNLAPAGKPVWTTAKFHQKVAVRVEGTYRPVITSLVGLGSSYPFTVTVLMGCEGN